MTSSPRPQPYSGQGGPPEEVPDSGKIAGRYTLERKLGSGSVGTVYLARDPVRRERVALKVMRTDRMTPRAVSRLQTEFRAIASLHHQQIAAAYDFGYTDSGLPFYTREYVEGVPLPPGPPDDDTPIDYLKPLLDLLDALSYLHDNDILHLDIHAGNLIVSPDPDRGGVLIDFGFHRSLEGMSTQPGPDWLGLPPELLERGRAAPQTDIFLVGRLLHLRLAGQAEGEVRLPREIPGWGPRLTLELERIATKALQPDMAQRFQSAREFREALRQVLGAGRDSPPIEPRNITRGRGRELEQIEEALRDVGNGTSRVVALSGDQGSGRTHLLAEARLRSQLRGLPTVEVQGDDSLGRGPALVRALRRSSAHSVAAKESLRWLDPLRVTHGGTPRERSCRSAEAFFAQDGKPLVLLVDDLESVDQQSAVLIEALATVLGERRRRKLPGRALALLVATERSSLTWTGKGDLCRLKPLTDRDARQLVQELITPIRASDRLLDGVLREAEGRPLRLRQAADVLREEWRRADALPDRAELLPGIPRRSPRAERDGRRFPPEDRRVFEVIGLIGHPARRAEIVAGLGGAARTVGASLQRLRESQIIALVGHGRDSRYRLCVAFSRDELGEQWSTVEIRKLHQRVADALRARQGASPRDHEELARHLLAAGRRAQGCTVALEAAGTLCGQGSFDRALRLLSESVTADLPLARRLRLAEESSVIAEKTGDHAAGIDVLEPLYRDELHSLSTRDALRVRRCLGIHYHRVGMADKALAVFEEAQRPFGEGLAGKGPEVRDLIFIDSELAEIYTFHGQYEAAESACRRGLDRLERISRSDPFYGSMELTLRASLGHLRLRRMDLARARTELARALGSCRRHGTTANRVAILNNLGITASQQDDFRGAIGYFNEAEKLSSGAGEQRGTIKIASNLALVHAKLGDRDAARKQLEVAAQLLHYYGGKRLDFFVAYARGVVAHLFGEAKETIEAFEEALPKGRQLEDRHMVSYGEVYLADAYLMSGDYQRAWKQLTSTARKANKEGSALLSRMVHSRLFLVETLLARPRVATRSWRILDATPRTSVTLLEAWNDLFRGFAHVLSGDDATATLQAALGVFEQLGVPAAIQATRVAMLVADLITGDRARIVEGLIRLERETSTGHRLFEVADPLVRAEARFSLKEIDAADIALQQASGSIVGSPFLELDWRIELLRARLAVHRGDIQEARRHLHRSSHTRDLLLQLVPAKLRDRYLSHSRFDELRDTEARLYHRSPSVFSTETLRRGASFEGMIGRSSEMLAVFKTIEKVSDQEVGVLLSGETGTGKELAARAIHRRSARAQKPFMAVHCAALPGEIFESELFGSEAGAYTGADRARPGILESLSGGTLLLDAVDQLPLDAQAKLLQVLDAGTFRRVGAVQLQHADVRFLASTSTNLSAAVSAGRFRSDLFYRIRGVEIELPPLRQRGEDITLLARHFAEKQAQRLLANVPSLSDDAIALLRRHPWPGNVRELEGIMLRLALTATAEESVTARHLRPYLSLSAMSVPDPAPFGKRLVELGDLGDLKRALERQYLTELFFKCEGDTQRLMAHLGVKSTRLYAWFRTLGIDVRKLRERL